MTKAAKRLSCAVVLKTGAPPGIMLAEGAGVPAWLEVVKKLRYKDYHLLKKDSAERALLNIKPGCVREFGSVRDLGAFLEGNHELYGWWRLHMGYQK